MTNSASHPDIILCKWNPKPIQILLDAGRSVHLVLDVWDHRFGGIAEEMLDQFASVHTLESFDSLPEVSGVAASLRDMGVIAPLVGSFAEFSQFGAGVLGDLLGSPNQSMELALRSRDKRAMKRAYVDGGVPCARWLSVPDISQPPSEDTVSSVVGWPAVLKPVSGMGAISTTVAANHDELSKTAKLIDLPPEVGCHQFVLEEHLAGSEFHVDAIWDKGEAWYLSVAEYPMPRLGINPGEEGTILLNEGDNPDLYRQVRELHELVNRAIGITDGATHFEFFQGPDGSLVASEVATRIGGGPVVDMIAGRDGFDLRELWAAQLAGLDRPEVVLGSGSKHTHVAAINIPPQGHGKVTRLPDQADFDANPHVISSHAFISVNEEAHSPWTLFLVLGARSRAEIDEVIADARRRYRVETEGLSNAR